MTNISDQILIRKYLQGDEKSLEVLILAYLKPIYSFTYRYVGNAQDAEDITQEVFVKVWRHLKRSATHIFCRHPSLQTSFKKLFDGARDARARIAHPFADETHRRGISCKKYAGFDPKKGSFKTWVFAIAKNTAIDFLKKKKTIPFSEFSSFGRSPAGGENEAGENMLTETLVDPAPLPQELLERAGIAQMLNKTMEKLSPKYRMVLFLRYNDHFTFREIAETLGESIDTVKSRNRRALIKIRKLLSKIQKVEKQ